MCYGPVTSILPGRQRQARSQTDLGTKASLCSCILAAWPGAGSPPTSLAVLICEVGEQSPCQTGPVRRK